MKISFSKTSYKLNILINIKGPLGRVIAACCLKKRATLIIFIYKLFVGGWSRNRTGVNGFAGRCITTLPSSHIQCNFIIFRTNNRIKSYKKLKAFQLFSDHLLNQYLNFYHYPFQINPYFLKKMIHTLKNSLLLHNI